MPECCGRCIVQVFETRKLKLDRVLKSDDDCEDPRPGDVRRVLESTVNLETADKVKGCPAECRCVRLKGQDPPWTPWTPTRIQTNFTRGPCVYTILATVEIRSRAFDALCIPGTITGKSYGAFAEPDTFFVVDRADPIDPEVLLRIRDLLA